MISLTTIYEATGKADSKEANFLAKAADLRLKLIPTELVYMP